MTSVKKPDKKDWFYSDEVKEHFFNPKNICKTDEELEKFISEADGIGEVGDASCGDVMKMMIKVKDGRITECKWLTFGCASAIASTSILSEMVTENGGMLIEEALKITPKQIVEKLEGLPNIKIHCSVLGDKALRAAIEDYKKKSKNTYL
ncbi:iron-sulfur cluster assembly scaffold protein [Nanoarchaeota archaeon]